MKRSSLAEVFARQAPGLRRFLSRFGSRVDPEDIVQAAFESVCQRNLDEIDDLEAYVQRTSRNLALNELRRSKRSVVSLFDPIELEELTAEAPSVNPEDILIAYERFGHMADVVRALPPKERNTLIWFRVHGLSHREIGERLGVSHRNVARYLARATSKCNAAKKAYDQE